jgi:PleD family two-component response regulator
MPDHPTQAAGEPRAFSLLLVVEDDLTANRLNEMLTRPEGTRFEITQVLRVEEALLELQEAHFDAMLIDLSVQEAKELDSLMRARGPASSVPIVVLTYQRDEEAASRAARAGAQDYLAKGEVTPELTSRTLVHAIERHRIIQDLTKAKRRHRFLATHDSLTELPNRYWFMEHLESKLASVQRRQTQLADLFFDIDGFKALNDNLGHAASTSTTARCKTKSPSVSSL